MIKSHTNIEQSEVLAKILPLESADMYYSDVPVREWIDETDTSKGTHVVFKSHIFAIENLRDHRIGEGDIYAWSLTALLTILPNEIITDNRFECHYQISIRKYDGGDNTTLYQIAYGNNRGLSGSWHDMINTGEKESLIDCCVQMIVGLRKMNLL